MYFYSSDLHVFHLYNYASLQRCIHMYRRGYILHVLAVLLDVGSHVQVCSSSVSPLPSSLVLSPAPTPITSPGVYTPVRNAGSESSKVKLEKWRQVARKLSLHNELRSQWNELKMKGGFSTNEEFIGHLLCLEAIRQASQDTPPQPSQAVETMQLFDEDTDQEVDLESSGACYQQECTVMSPTEPDGNHAGQDEEVKVADEEVGALLQPEYSTLSGNESELEQGSTENRQPTVLEVETQPVPDQLIDGRY